MASEKRLIDAYKLEDLVRSNSARYHNADDVIAAIARQPTVDAVEVLRCKNCKHWEDRNKGGCGMCWKKVTRTEEDHYCGYGEKREG